ncbi:hypothetical protein IMG5_183380 [Ichthyophthirius multifiliis]|uniref:Coronin n=1 Tax=Ichthyophthirius multifiliis TaxID=5932 RepID=G0R358_ICHMU|nr:hypothetical protein IMG5_183380 [Ichthyophthirius multifiliis]EGR28081.1 hypothetical protein IMG5_183380 [Ichthyophthirius multifiliis]|eukprot:XP_004027426.1 hypothetical protein IMG5_183380 [Ichthyophthirius multifiliis]
MALTKYKFKNVFGQPLQRWDDLKPLGATTDGFVIDANQSFIAFVLSSGGGIDLGILNHNQTGRVQNIPRLRGHQGPITDFKFLPHLNNLIASCSEDTTIKIWQLQDDNKEDIVQPQQNLNGHHKKINLLCPHLHSQGILASSSYDNTVQIWDIEQGKSLFSIKQDSKVALSLDWSQEGSILGSSWNDKMVKKYIYILYYKKKDENNRSQTIINSRIILSSLRLQSLEIRMD